jgi:hypothetical protein
MCTFFLDKRPGNGIVIMVILRSGNPEMHRAVKVLIRGSGKEVGTTELPGPSR